MNLEDLLDPEKEMMTKEVVVKEPNLPEGSQAPGGQEMVSIGNDTSFKKEEAVASHRIEESKSAARGPERAGFQVNCIELVRTILSPIMSKVRREQEQKDGLMHAEVARRNKVSLVRQKVPLVFV